MFCAIVYEEDGRTVVSAVDAAKMLSVVDNPKLESTAKTVNDKLRRVIDSLFAGNRTVKTKCKAFKAPPLRAKMSKRSIQSAE
jgi:hypothetical protein